MTPEAQRIAIAEACGWRVQVNCGSAGGVTLYNPQGYRTEGLWANADNALSAGTPDYNADLNAMHEAEMALTDEQMSAYGQRLADMISPEDWDERLEAFVSGGYGLFAISTATAAQRAEAFLRTIGKWEDGK